MFSDSHCHLFHISQSMPHFPLLLKMLEEQSFQFVMDIGTEAGDFSRRFNAVADAWADKGCIPGFIHFSAGLWPSKQAIENRTQSLRALEQDIQSIFEKGLHYAAVGECGIDRYWNGSGGKKGGCADTESEEALFKAQLALARQYNLAVIIHSRNGFKPTVECIDEIGWNKGVIHCFSYGKEEACQFLERGWYLSFPGTITYYKTEAEKQRIADIMRTVPHDRLLLETDAPYLTPQSARGEVNTPLFIAEVYSQASEFLGVSTEYLCSLVYENCCKLFALHA